MMISTLYPIDGQTDYHVHTVDELMLICSGYGEFIIGEQSYKIEAGFVLYAPAGKKHQCKNCSSETMQMACFCIPSLQTVDKMKGDKKLKNND
jgi:mannose-6-phosphate isomerase-like protein (cupin superfamily)